MGKTTALGELARQLQQTGTTIRAFSPTNDAAATLQGKLGIRTNTVAHLVLSKPDNTPGQLWIVDEAGMVSAKQMQAVGRKAEAVGARLLLVGDKGQNSSIEAGSPLRSLIDNGATTHHIRQIIRQQDSIQRQAVELIADGQGSPALELLNSHGYVTEMADRDERAQAIAGQYLGLSEKERGRTEIVTGTNAERVRINKVIRTGLKAERVLGESVNVVQLVSRQLTDEQSRRVQNYQIGDYIKLHRDYASTPLQRRQLYKVEQKLGQELLVSSYGGRVYRFNPANYKEKEVSHAQSIEIAVGDRLRWTATDKKQGQVNGKAVTVTALEGTTMSVKDSLGRTQEVSLLQPLTMDYNLVSTSYRAQSKSQKRVIASATSDPTSAQEPFYVQISRQTQLLSVYTQDLEQLRTWVKQSNAQQNPIALIGEEYGNRTESHTSSGLAAPPEPRITQGRPEQPGRSPSISNPALPADASPAVKRGAPVAKGDHQAIERVQQAPGRKEPLEPSSQESNLTRHPQPTEEDQHGNVNQWRHGQRDRSVDSGGTSYQDSESGIDSAEQRTQGAPQQLNERHPNHHQVRAGELSDPVPESLGEPQDAREHRSIPGTGRVDRRAEESADQLGDDASGHERSSQFRSLRDSGVLDPLVQQRLDEIRQQTGGAVEGRAEEGKAEEEGIRAEVAVTLPDSLDERINTLADLVNDWQDQQAVEGLVEQVQEIVAELGHQGLLQEQPHQYLQIEGAAEALAQWQDQNLLEPGLLQELYGLTQQLTSRPELLSTHQYEAIAKVTELLCVEQDDQLLQQSAIIPQMVELAQQLMLIEPETGASYTYSQMQAAAEQVGEYRAEDAIAEAMSLFKETAQQFRQGVQTHPALEQLANTVRSLRNTQELVTQEPADQAIKRLATNLRQKQLSVTPMPKKLEAFWQPGPTPVAPAQIDPAHWREWVEDSCIHPAIAAARLQSLEGDAVYERLLSDKLSTMGSGQYVTKPMAQLMKVYEPLAEHGGWWTDSGVDPRSFSTLRPGESPQVTLYGTFKPNHPRQDQGGEDIKYENPRGLKQELFERDLNFSTVPDQIAERIYAKYKVTPTPEDKASGFWYVVYKHPEIPIYRTEGNKKDAAITSQGRVVISGQGVNAGYRARDRFGDLLPQRVLHPQLEVFAQAGREIRFTFDQDSKVSTILNVRQDLVREAELLQEKGCQIYNLSWDHHQGKGADDLIVNQGPFAFEKADSRAVPIEKIMAQHYRTKYNAIAKQVKKELGNIPPERLDLEVYIQALRSGDSKDGSRFIAWSDTARLRRKDSPGTDTDYVQAIAAVAGTYQRLKEREAPNLDKWTVRTVQIQEVRFGQKEEEKLKYRLEQPTINQHRKGPGL